MSKEYIEREALKEDLKESYDRLRAIYDSFTYDEDKQICAGQLTTFTEAILRVKDAPAADVTPVRHGRWIGIDSSFWKPTHRGDIPVFRKTYRCSECRRRTAIAENYCPNCGAKMDKEETNERI